MRPRLVIAVGILTILLGTIPAPGRAIALLPNCEKTVYLVKHPPTAPDGVEILSGPYKTKIIVNGTEVIRERGVTPEQYNFDNHGPIKTLTTNAQCGFNDFLRLFLNIANWAMGLLAALALLFFIWGGFTMLIAGGRSTKVDEGKKILSGAFIGILIVLTSWVLVGFWVSVTVGDACGTVFAGTTFARVWHGGSCQPSNIPSCRFSQAYRESCQYTDLEGIHRGCGDGQRVAAGPITAAQQILAQAGCYEGTADGCFGPQTEAGVTAYQELHGITENLPLPPTGHIGPNTWLQLEAPSNERCQ